MQIGFDVEVMVILTVDDGAQVLKSVIMKKVWFSTLSAVSSFAFVYMVRLCFLIFRCVLIISFSMLKSHPPLFVKISVPTKSRLSSAIISHAVDCFGGM